MIDKILHDYTKTRSQKRKMESSPSYIDTMANTPTSRKLRLNKNNKKANNPQEDDEKELSNSSTKSMATLRKNKQMRKQQFGHRVKCYKRRNFVRKNSTSRKKIDKNVMSNYNKNVTDDGYSQHCHNPCQTKTSRKTTKKKNCRLTPSLT